MAEVRLDLQESELPAEVYGFSVEIFWGPYPIDARGSHRRAIYARLRPLTPELVARLKWIGRTQILGQAELDAAGAAALEAGTIPDVEREALALAVLRPAMVKAREVARR